MSLQIEKKLRTEKVCSKCGQTIYGNLRACPYCSGNIISKTIVQQVPSKGNRGKR